MISDELILLINLNKVQSLLSRKYDALNVHGLGFSDFMILYLLDKTPGQGMRRIDLAEKVGLTASGVTRLLNPLEKTGLVKRMANERDARVSYVVITTSGQKILEEAKVTAESITKEFLGSKKTKSMQVMSQLLFELGGNIQ